MLAWLYDSTMIIGNYFMPEGLGSVFHVPKDSVIIACFAAPTCCKTTRNGKVAEWSNALDSKSSVRLYRTVGSNPTLSASSTGFIKAALGRLFLYLQDFSVALLSASAAVWHYRSPGSGPASNHG